MSKKLDQVTKEIVNEFLELAKIPRKSGHEQAVSDYLVQWANNKGFSVVQDAVNNVIIERPADPGCENKPLTILQGHMDMVCVGKEGCGYDPLTDPIQVVIDEDAGTITAKDTSLGADDGIGVAIAQHILTSGTGCGPLRVIFTVNEEELMLGAKEVDKKYLEGTYLINLDSENDEILTNSSAGGMSVILSRIPKTKAPKYKRAIAISISGLVGGHSGVEINSGHLNAIRAICYTLLALEQAGVRYQLGSISGGVADNAIPSQCTAVLVIHPKDQCVFDRTFQKIEQMLHDTYDCVEPNLLFSYEDAKLPGVVLAKVEKQGVLTCATQVINGVHTMSPLVDGLVQSSSNLGIISVNKKEIRMTVYWRSSEELFIEQMKAQNTALANWFHLDVEVKSNAPGWPVNPLSKLVPLVTRIYKEQAGKEMEVAAIHAGLECSWFYAKNPKLDLISVGPNLAGVHSPAETLQIASIVKTYQLVLETLRRIE